MEHLHKNAISSTICSSCMKCDQKIMQKNFVFKIRGKKGFAFRNAIRSVIFNFYFGKPILSTICVMKFGSNNAIS